MDNYIKNILPIKKKMLAIDEDINLNIQINSETKPMPNQDLISILNISDQFNLEREESKKYRISGNVEFLSPFSSIKINPTTLNDLFDLKSGDDNTSTFYNFTDFFDIYLMQPDRYELVKGTTNNYDLYLKTLTTLNDIIVEQAGFSVNIFEEKIYQFINNKIIDLNDVIISSDDKIINVPITELYLFFKFKYSDDNITRTDNFTTTYNNIDLNNLLYGTILFDINQFSFTDNSNINYDINLPVLTNTSTLNLEYVYNPFYKIKLKDYNSEYEVGNIITETNIPIHASIINDETNNFNSHQKELLTITEYPIFSGTSRLTINDPLFMLPRKYIYNTITNSYEYYLEYPIYDVNRLSVSVNKLDVITGKYNTTELKYYTDYYFSDETNKKIFFKYNNFNLNDIVIIDYFTGQNYIWRDILSNGNIDTLNNIGVNYPFVNGCHYLYENIKLICKPDLTNNDTASIYNKFIFGFDDVKNNLNNNFGKNC
jgi:hypothetical protein